MCEDGSIGFLCNLRLTEFDQILVCGSWGKATDVKVGFAKLLSSSSTAAAAAAAIAEGHGIAIAIAVWAWRSHLMVGR